jgi:hypothetical protein
VLDYINLVAGHYAEAEMVNELGRTIRVTAQTDFPCNGKAILTLAGPDSMAEWFVTNAELEAIHAVLGRVVAPVAPVPAPALGAAL